MRIVAVLIAASMLTGPAWAQDALPGLSGEISAILDLSTAPRLLIVERANGVSNVRTLGVGDEYRDGWSFAAVEGRDIVLKKGAQARRVRLPEGLAQAPAEASQIPVADGRITNAAVQTPKAPAPWAQAIAKGDVRAAFTAGAPATDVLAALRQAAVLKGASPAGIDAFLQRRELLGADMVKITGASGGVGLLQLNPASGEAWLVNERGEFAYTSDLDHNAEWLTGKL